MHKYIQYFLVATSVWALSACGSNSKVDPVKSETSESVNGYSFSGTEESLTINTYKSYNIKFRLTLDDFALEGANVQMKIFDAKFGTIASPVAVTDASGFGHFTYNPPVVMPDSGTSTVIQYVYQAVGSSGNTKELVQSITLNFNFDTNNGGDGRATTLSISYLTTTCNEQEGIIGHYNVHAVDERSNVPVVGLDVEFSLINGVKVIRGIAIQKSSGKINNTTPVSFSDGKTNFASASVSANDNLIILPSQGASDISYLGGWNINGVGNDLTLFSEYTNIVNSNNLTYIIGNEERLLGGENGSVGVHTAAHVQAVDAVTDSNGFAYFDIVFDSILGGHTVVVEAHGSEDGKRFGISKKEFLRLDNFSAPTIEIINSGTTRDVYVPISIEPGCIGNQPLIHVPVSFSSFSIEPSENCAIVGGDFVTNSAGNVRLSVASDGKVSSDTNETTSDKCTITWEGGPQSLGYEY